ncbi:MAG TPA: hypothetical protein VLL08_03390 [Kineosporiaceae bacterium]|nr:hypothetical protein [Kineosporiaceae bacterium]
MSRIEDLSMAGWRTAHDGEHRPPLRARLPELSSKIVGGLGILLLSPTVLTAASRSQLEATDPATPTSPDSAPKTRGDVGTRIAVVASGLAAMAALVYTAPGVPWHRADSAAPVTGIVGAEHAGDPGMDMAHAAATAYSGFIRSPDRTVLVDATPATVGTNTVAITVLDAEKAPAKVEQWSGTASLPGASDVAVPLASFGPGVAVADIQLPVAGKWTFTVTYQVAGAKPTTLTHVVPIGP